MRAMLPLLRWAHRPLTLQLLAPFALPKHQLLTMPSLSPTMKEGKVIKWLVKPGQKIEVGDVIAEIETDKATVPFEVQDKGYLASVNQSEGMLEVGSPIAVITKKLEEVGEFKEYKFDGAAATSNESEPSQKPATSQKPTSNSESKKSDTPSAKLPKHQILTMPSLSPTMTEGKVVKWLVKPGQKIDVGDVIAEIQTDKATVPFEVQDKGYLASINQSESMLEVGSPLAVITKKEEEVSEFKNYKFNGTVDASQTSQKSASKPEASKSQSSTTQSKRPPTQNKLQPPSSNRVFASPIAKSMANQKGISLSEISGSGPGGRIIKQDVQNFQPSKQESKQETKQETKQSTKPAAKQATPDANPYEDIPLSGMRKTIASRLLESKQTVPHYYISDSIQMDAVMALRVDINKNEKQNGVKITINDIIIKAVALALRDIPDVNVQWQGNFIRKFKHSDISVAVAIEGGLITPIVHKAETLGLLDIARKTKDLAKRAREGKLSPQQYQGGTSSVSNIGMFGIDSVASIINPPQASILGVGKTDKKLLWADGDPPYRVAQVCQLIGSLDHRAVDGALGAQWLRRIKFYLQKPTNMLL